VSVPTSGTNTLETAPCTIEGKEYHNVNLGDYMNILKESHELTLEDVQKFLVWIMGDAILSLLLPAAANMIIKTIKPNEPGNVCLVNKCLILLRQYSVMLNFIIKNHLQHTSYTFFNPKSNTVEYQDEVSGRK
jgi:hypothetical protein